MVSALKQQRNAALDNVASIAAEFSELNAKHQEALKELAELKAATVKDEADQDAA